MLLLNQNTTNNCYLTLTDSTTLTASTVYYLFRFVSQTTNTETLFTAPDLSTNYQRYNLFNITLTGGTTNYTAGTISLHPDGEYLYEVFEQLSPSNLFLSGTSGTIIEYGIAKVSGTSLNFITAEYSGDSSAYYYIEP